MKNFTYEFDKIGLSLYDQLPMRIRLYTLCQNFNITQKYITSDHMLTSSSIFYGLISSTFVSDLYGSM